MCGIVCYVGKNLPLNDVAARLLKLEYRGYDSSGMAYVCGGKLQTEKQVGRIKNLLPNIDGINSSLVISHTRWATHGGVTVKNAHPQLSPSGRFAVVHNGIIENYLSLKQDYDADKFSSQTDTEVVAHLLDKACGDTLQRLQKATEGLQGSWALAVIDEQDNSLYIAKNKSPLYVAKHKNGTWVASDISCFNSDNYYALPDGCVAQIDANKCQFFVNGNKVDLQPKKLDSVFEECELQGYDHFMQKEMAETGNVIANICNYYEQDLGKLQNLFNDVSHIDFVGCGTAYHACMLAANWAKQNLRISAEARVASEFRYCDPVLGKNNAVVLVSQSGETADTLAVGEMAKKFGAPIYAVTNVEYSAITGLADKVFALRAGPEIAVASTKAYSAMLAVLYLMTCGKPPKFAIEQLKNLPITQALNLKLPHNIIEGICKSKRIFYLGRQDDGVTANEGALKLKEIAYLDACGYFAGELKHGTIALIEPNVWVVAIITDSKLAAKTLSAVQEVSARGAKVLVVTNLAIEGDFNQIVLPKTQTGQLNSLVSILPLQQLAYQVSVAKGWDPDRPRNLAKSVTVE